MKALRISRKLAMAAIALLGCRLIGSAQETTDETPYDLTISPFVRFIEVEGNRSAFSQHTMLEDGLDAGFEFDFSTVSESQGKLDISGMATFDQSDYELDVEWQSPSKMFFINADFEQYHRYYDNTGWFYEGYDIPVWSLNQNLSVEIGKFGLELGFRPDPDKITEFVVGYQYHWKEGDKVTLADNTQNQGGLAHHIYPSHMNVDDDSHVLTLAGTVDLDFVVVRDRFRYENYKGDGMLFEVTPEGVPGNATPTDIGRLHKHSLEFSQYSNALSLEKWIGEGLLLSGGYLYSNYEGDTTERYQYLRFGTANRQHFDTHDDLSLEQESHVFNLNAMWLPAADWAVIAGLSAEYSETDVAGEARMLETINNAGLIGPLEEPNFDSTLDKFGLTESLEVRYSGLLGTTLYARGDFTQEDYEQRELTEEAGSITSDRDSDTDRNVENYRVGFNSSAINNVTFGAYYQHKRRGIENSYDADPATGYTAFITWQEIETDEASARLLIQHSKWLRTFYKVTTQNTDYDTETDDTGGPGGRAHSGNIDSQSYVVGATVTPPDSGLYLTSQFALTNYRTTIPASGNAVIPVYRGDVWSALASANWDITGDTTLNLSYQYERANNDDEDPELIAAGGLPRGIKYDRQVVGLGVRHRFTDKLTGFVNYTYYQNRDDQWNEDGSYTANAVVTGLTLTF